MKELWDQRYSQDGYMYGTDPNAFLKEELTILPKGSILLPADGEGRNAVFAASIGWDVTAFDQSEAGRKKALSLAESRGLTIQYILASVPGFDPGEEKYDCIALIFFHLPPELRSSFHRACIRALKPGGTIILEAFDKSQLGNNSGGPKDSALLMSIAELQQDFKELHDLELFRQKVVLQEGAYHSGEAEVIRLIGKRG
jgi:SAM-dependent methyltransferase